MKKFASLLLVAILGGGITLGAYKYLENNSRNDVSQSTESPFYQPVSYSGKSISSTNADFTEAAERTVHAVVHVKNVQLSRTPRSLQEFFYGGGELKPGLAGAGSGVIISADGFIITNNHVIDKAAEIEVSLNNNRVYKAKVIGADPKADIALIKIEADEDLPYLTFGNSDNVRVGEWALAVGNPFNLTSTVTAGIISAKARDLSKLDPTPQSFIQTDAAINPGNSGGALVNINGELIGINTAITSQTGSYVGYGFAVPSNIARKIVEDIMEYGDVQRGILGVSGQSLNAQLAEELGIKTVEGFYVGIVEPGSGADKAGLKEGDIIKALDGIQITKFADLSGYLSSRRPGDLIQVKILRNGNMKTVPVELTKSQTFIIPKPGLEVRNTSPEILKEYGVNSGVMISRVASESLQRYNLRGILITEIDEKKVKDVEDVKRILENKDPNEPVSISFVGRDKEKKQFIFQ